MGSALAANTLPPDPDALMTEAQTAEFLQVSIRTLQANRVRGGGPPYVKLGRSVRYRRRDVIAWLDQRLRVHTSQSAAE